MAAHPNVSLEAMLSGRRIDQPAARIDILVSCATREQADALAGGYKLAPWPVDKKAHYRFDSGLSLYTLGWLMGLEPTTTGITILDSTN
jgi:hypothetical protein